MNIMLERFEKYYMPEPNSGCWIWLGALAQGYGRLYERPGKIVQAHRFSYETFKGIIPVGYDIDHLCRNRCCVNPAHLEAVTRRENLLRSALTQPAINLSKTHCKRGHLLVEGNLLKLKQGGRSCAVCNRLRQTPRN